MLSPRKGLTIAKESGSHFVKDDAMHHAAAISFYAAFSLAPMLMVTIAIVSTFIDRDIVQEKILGQFGSLMGEQGRGLFATMLTESSKPKEGAVATVLGILAVILGASGAFAQLKAALNTVWQVAPAPKKGTWYASVWRLVRTRLLSFGMVMVVAFLLLASLVISAGLAAAGDWASNVLPFGEGVMHLVNFIVGFAVTTVLLAMIFKILPDARIGWREVWLGAAVTAALFSVGKFGIGLYLGKSSVASVYGAAGSIVIVLLWLYYSTMIFLMGAEVTKVTAKHLGKAIQPAKGFVRHERLEVERPGPAVTPSDRPQPTRGRPSDQPRGRAA